MQKNTPFKISRKWPLIGFAIPLVIIGLGVALPGTCITGFDEMSVGFVATPIGAGVALLGGRVLTRPAGDRHV